MRIVYSTVYIPHLNYTVHFKPFTKAPASIRTAHAFIQRDDRDNSSLFLARNVEPSTVAHELVHVLQYICEDRYMVFTDEREHMCYLMQYLMVKAGGGKWAKRTAGINRP